MLSSKNCCQNSVITYMTFSTGPGRWHTYNKLLFRGLCIVSPLSSQNLWGRQGGSVIFSSVRQGDRHKSVTGIVQGPMIYEDQGLRWDPSTPILAGLLAAFILEDSGERRQPFLWSELWRLASAWENYHPSLQMGMGLLAGLALIMAGHLLTLSFPEPSSMLTSSSSIWSWVPCIIHASQLSEKVPDDLGVFIG